VARAVGPQFPAASASAAPQSHARIVAVRGTAFGRIERAESVDQTSSDGPLGDLARGVPPGVEAGCRCCERYARSNGGSPPGKGMEPGGVRGSQKGPGGVGGREREVTAGVGGVAAEWNEAQAMNRPEASASGLDLSTADSILSTEAQGAGRREVTVGGIIGPLSHVHPLDDLRNQEVEVGIALPMGV